MTRWLVFACAVLLPALASADYDHSLPTRVESFGMHVRPAEGIQPPIPRSRHVDVRDLPALVRSTPSGPPVRRGQVCGRNGTCVAVDDRPVPPVPPVPITEDQQGEGDR